ncbi:hypothetical protein [Variovorax ginsengisoli]|uniref:Uncharacterized protein n=1 Tax=Variovorax ginsengisoli TaxID=363844 RepID=A0ABT8S177_9BURK|nr:hypothetical protein [Variovorax ginsengisoli]MDN8613410.1 hypothetical protein [Variovorax ginsengisoli]MDO1532580.1 hypothetical protein [Variovorax ginsengisoli]
MNAMPPQTWTLVAIVAAVIVIALAAYAIHRSKQSQGLRSGPNTTVPSRRTAAALRPKPNCDVAKSASGT